MCLVVKEEARFRQILVTRQEGTCGSCEVITDGVVIFNSLHVAVLLLMMRPGVQARACLGY